MIWIRKKHQCLLCSTVLASSAAWKLAKQYGDTASGPFHEGIIEIIRGQKWKDTLQICLCLALGSAMYDMFRRDPADSHSWLSLIKQYLSNKLLVLVSGMSRKRMMTNCKNVDQSQHEVLMEILARGKLTAYGKEHKFDGVETVENFIKIHSLTDHTHYKSYVDRAIGGEENVMFPEPVEFIAATSGTTAGKSKLFPVSLKLTKKIYSREHLACIWYMFMAPGASKLKRHLVINLQAKTTKTLQGVPLGPLTASNKISDPAATTPLDAGSQILGLEEALYIHLLFALKVSDIGMIMAPLSSHMVSFFRLLEEKWDDICLDIQLGRINAQIDIPSDIRMKLECILRPDRSRAIELRREFRHGFKDIVPRIWPDCVLVMCIASGPFLPYTELLRQKYLGLVPVYSVVHGGTEGSHGINMCPESKDFVYTIHPKTVFYEFIPALDVDHEQPFAVRASEVKAGHEYEMVITNHQGLYRYRTGDVIKIVGHFYEAPMYTFVQRVGDVLNLYAEKTPVRIISDVIQEIFSKWDDIQLIEFTFTESIHLQQTLGVESGKMYYCVFVEIEHGGQITDSKIQKLDDCLRQNQEAYGISRERARIAPMRVLVLKNGAFRRLRQQVLAANQSASVQQFKVPRVVRRHELIKCLMDGCTVDKSLL